MLTLKVREDIGTWTVETWGDRGLLARTVWRTEDDAEAYAKRIGDTLDIRIVARVVPTGAVRP